MTNQSINHTPRRRGPKYRLTTRVNSSNVIGPDPSIFDKSFEVESRVKARFISSSVLISNLSSI